MILWKRNYLMSPAEYRYLWQTVAVRGVVKYDKRAAPVSRLVLKLKGPYHHLLKQ